MSRNVSLCIPRLRYSPSDVGITWWLHVLYYTICSVASQSNGPGLFRNQARLGGNPREAVENLSFHSLNLSDLSRLDIVVTSPRLRALVRKLRPCDKL